MGKIGQIITVKEKNINTPLKELKVKVKKKQGVMAAFS